jgi:hypothetical protein
MVIGALIEVAFEYFAKFRNRNKGGAGLTVHIPGHDLLHLFVLRMVFPLPRNPRANTPSARHDGSTMQEHALTSQSEPIAS